MPKTQLGQRLLFLTLFFALNTPTVPCAAGTEATKAKPNQPAKEAKKPQEEKPKADPEHDQLEFRMDIALGSKHWETEDFPEATRLYKIALEFAQSHFPANDIRIAQAALYLGRSENFGNKNYDQARQYYELSRDTIKKIPGDNGFILGDVLFELACVYAKQGQISESDPILLQAMNIYSMTFGPDDNHMASVLHRQGKNLMIQGKPEQAISLIERAATIFEKKQMWAKLGTSYTDLADACSKAGKTEQAQEYKKKAEELYAEHPKDTETRIE